MHRSYRPHHVTPSGFLLWGYDDGELQCTRPKKSRFFREQLEEVYENVAPDKYRCNIRQIRRHSIYSVGHAKGKATIANIVLATMRLGPCPSLSFWKSRRTASGLMQPANTNALLPRTQHEFRAAFPILSSPKFIPKTHFIADHNIEKLSLNKECPLVLLLLNYQPIIWKSHQRQAGFLTGSARVLAKYSTSVENKQLNTNAKTL